jgi:hypothetical protein
MWKNVIMSLSGIEFYSFFCQWNLVLALRKVQAEFW